MCCMGLVDRPVGSIGLTTDFINSNRQAQSRREIQAFEEQLAMLAPELEAESDSDDDTQLQEQGRARADLSWSDEAGQLEKLAQNKKLRKFGHMENINSFLKTLRLRECGINTIDADVAQLVNLQELNVSGNRITNIRFLPPKLQALQAYDNCIARLDLSQSFCAPNILHLGLGHNEIAYLNWLEDFDQLRILDLSYNQISDLENALWFLKNLRFLQVVHLEGNPCSLLPGYRRRVLSALPQVTILDGIAVDDVPCFKDESKQEPDQGQTPTSLAIRLDLLSAMLNQRVARPRSEEEEEEEGGGGEEKRGQNQKVQENGETADQSEQAIPEVVKKYGIVVVATLPGGQVIKTPLVENSAIAWGDLEEDELPSTQEGEEAPMYLDIKRAHEFVQSSNTLELQVNASFRDSVEFDGIAIGLYHVEQTLLLVKPQDESQPDDSEDLQEQPEYSVVSEEEQLVSQGSIDLSQLLDPKSMGKISFMDQQLALENPLAKIASLYPERLPLLEGNVAGQSQLLKDGNSVKFSLWVNDLPPSPDQDEEAVTEELSN